ncbi:MAG TPA: hypothetical protein VFZ52_08675 [Chryseolinea sp.]
MLIGKELDKSDRFQDNGSSRSKASSCTTINVTFKVSNVTLFTDIGVVGRKGLYGFAGYGFNSTTQPSPVGGAYL